LLAFGLTHGQAVTVIYAGHAMMVGCAYLLRWQTDTVLAVVYLIFAIGLFSIFVCAPRETGSDDPRSGSVPLVDGRRLSGRWEIGEVSLTLLYLTVPLYLIGSIAAPREIPIDAGIIAGALALAVLISFFLPTVAPWAVRAALYIGSTSLMYYGDLFPRGIMIQVVTPVNLGVAVLAILVILAIRLAGEERFQTTPLDYLIILLAGVMPFLPGMAVGEVAMGLLAAKLIVLFFAFELLLNMRASAVTRLGMVALAMLAGVMLRAWWP
jgi:UDP-GlcNAc:undecaprenyl-phosphate GlcNAc-1-phosphate transferase